MYKDFKSSDDEGLSIHSSKKSAAAEFCMQRNFQMQ